ESTAHYNAAAMNPQVLVIGESRAAATAFTNQGSELVETTLDAFVRDNEKAGDTKVFAALYGNASEYATGSNVKVNGFSGIVGVGKTNDNGLTVGAFFENGEGNYRTYNSLNGGFMRGDGEANYNGGGLLIRKDNANGVYTEASLRAGNLQNELRNAVQGSEGLAGYDIDTFYYGAHLGIGKVISRGNDGDSIDVYGKFIYTHHDSEDFQIDGDDFHFDSVDSERLRLGFRINEVQNNKLNMYYGAAWEYEFNGDANNTVVGYDLTTPSLGGSTVIGELGMHYKASDKWSLDLNGRAYVGQREGFSGSVQANYNF
ncbi:MAG: autotransporter outer membrane beta-barrel domain-containing protein, partial [Phascolarctobacterium sp.]|nr:autotransporter outer membrane beta-barrel domain-containing protein [Phascolarctobacterium sp.]